MIYEVCTETLRCAGHFGWTIFVRLNAAVSLQNVGTVRKSVWILKIPRLYEICSLKYFCVMYIFSCPQKDESQKLRWPTTMLLVSQCDALCSSWHCCTACCALVRVHLLRKPCCVCACVDVLVSYRVGSS